MYVLNWLKQKTQIDKTDVFGEKTYHAIPRSFGLFSPKSSNRNNRYRLSINFKHAIWKLSTWRPSLITLQWLFFNHLHYTVTARTELRLCFRIPVRTSHRIPDRSPNALAVEVTAFIPFCWTATEIFVRTGSADVKTVFWSWKEGVLRQNQEVKRT